MKKEKTWYREVAEVAAAIVVAWLFYQSLAFAMNTPMPIVSVVSDSMEPNLHRGDLLVVTGMATADYKTGDIVIYQRPEVSYTIVHRIIEKTEEGFVIKGDNNASPDPGFVKPSQILGKVEFAIPLLGYPRLALHAVGI
ncbi:MAG: signal peptidase I [Candidatus Aenigmarchaeota archaeon]|nr:signal peptidase I [Candidatus Aenigmarchaeota archaeon]